MCHPHFRTLISIPFGCKESLSNGMKGFSSGKVPCDGFPAQDEAGEFLTNKNSFGNLIVVFSRKRKRSGRVLGWRKIATGVLLPCQSMSGQRAMSGERVQNFLCADSSGILGDFVLKRRCPGRTDQDDFFKILLRISSAPSERSRFPRSMPI